MIALIVTIAAEIFAISLLTRNRMALVVFSAVTANLITNPLANHLYPEFGFVEIEIAVIVIEALIFTLLFESGIRRGTGISLCANLPTALMSLLFI